MLQGTGEFDELTVAEVVRHFAGFYPRRRRPGRGDRAGRAGRARREARTHTLSGGQKRRLDVALGIVGRPELLFLDEPTTGFDPEARREFWELIRDLAAAGTTIVLTTHYLDEAEALADRVGVIAGGRLVEVATAEPAGQPAGAPWRRSPGVPGRAARDARRRATPTALVAELAARFGGEVPGLTVTRPTLEDVYLQDDRTPMTTTTKPATPIADDPARRLGPVALALRAGPAGDQAVPAQPGAVVFTMLFPVIMILIFGVDLQRRDRRRASSSPSTSSPA